MAKKPKKRRKRTERIRGGMRVVVAAGPDAGVSVANELELAKAALVYSDQVAVISPIATLYTRLRELGTADLRTQAELGARLAPWISEDPAASAGGFQMILESLNKKPGTLDARDLWLRAEMAKEMAPVSEELAETIDASVKTSGFDQFDRAAPRASFASSRATLEIASGSWRSA